jgi:hypothetical protein
MPRKDKTIRLSSAFAERDITGHCGYGHHDRCNGILTGGTGFHWFCACSCHPEPAEGPVIVGYDKAVEVWRQHREVAP